ncbi:MAG: Uma2 family endonuclease [Sandaracinaceae bacterium]
MLSSSAPRRAPHRSLRRKPSLPGTSPSILNLGQLFARVLGERTHRVEAGQIVPIITREFYESFESSDRTGNARLLGYSTREAPLPREAAAASASRGRRSAFAAFVLWAAEQPVVRHPNVIVEVLSPSTRGRDAGAKLDDYFRLGSLVHYLRVKTENRTVIHHQRRDPGTRARGGSSSR